MKQLTFDFVVEGTPVDVHGCGNRIMKSTSLRKVSLNAILAVVCSVAGHAEDAAVLSKRALQAKIEYCEDCHGASGQGYRGFLPMPRLAGQQTAYFENQLRAFIEHRRQSKFMYDVSRGLSPATRRALAAHFSNIDPKPLGGAPRELVATGKKIYEDGVPESNIPACMACHGPEAKGQDAIPRLAGQLHDYIINKLTNWTKERDRDPTNPDPSTVMTATSHAMTRSQIAAVAAYVSYRQ
jgi:cytochrome c553